MRLYLSSFRLGEKTSELVELFGDNANVAIVANAVDHAMPSERSRKVQSEIDLLKDLGFICSEIDLRKYFANKAKLVEDLKDFDAIWVRGGNSFLLRRAFKQSGFDEILPKLLASDSIAYGGYSAGCCVLAPTLKGLDFVDNPNELSQAYDEEIVWNGLGILPYTIAPHYKSDHPESADVDKCIDYFIKNDMPHKPLRDGEVIVINSDDQ